MPLQYKEALARVQLRYGEAQPKEILHKLLDADADRDIVAGGMPGQAGGEMLACYLFSIKDDGHPKLADGIEPWLLRQLPRYQQHLRTAACLQRAIDFALLRQHHMAGLGWLGMAGDGPRWPGTVGMDRDSWDRPCAAEFGDCESECTFLCVCFQHTPSNVGLKLDARDDKGPKFSQREKRERTA